MSLALIGRQDDPHLWVVDFEAGSVTKFDEHLEGDLAVLEGWCKQGAMVMRGIKVAVALNAPADQASGVHEK